MNSYVIKKEQCPKCKLLGKDNSLDNLAIYSDNHSFCYSCGYISYPNRLKNFSKTTEPKVQESTLLLPEDSNTNYPKIALDWINQYELTENDLLLNNVLYSNSISRLIFPIYNSDWSIIAWQGRYFGDNEETKKKQKWFGRGNLRDTFNILGNKESNRLVLTEDILSAIKVAKMDVMAMPLYGSFVGRERFKWLLTILGREVKIEVWLDPDKRTEAIKEAKMGILCGLITHPILSTKDPKEHTFLEIEEILKIT